MPYTKACASNDVLQEKLVNVLQIEKNWKMLIYNKLEPIRFQRTLNITNAWKKFLCVFPLFIEESISHQFFTWSKIGFNSTKLLVFDPEFHLFSIQFILELKLYKFNPSGYRFFWRVEFLTRPKTSRVIFSPFANWRVSGEAIALRELARYASAITIYATIITVISYVT